MKIAQFTTAAVLNALLTLTLPAGAFSGPFSDGNFNSSGSRPLDRSNRANEPSFQRDPFSQAKQQHKVIRVQRGAFPHQPVFDARGVKIGKVSKSTRLASGSTQLIIEVTAPRYADRSLSLQVPRRYNARNGLRLTRSAAQIFGR